MDALALLLNRNSHPALQAPAPNGEELRNIFDAAFRAPDHAQLQPTRLIVIEGGALNQLGELFGQVVLEEDPSADEAAVAKAKGKPLRAPMIIAVVSKVVAHPKVPDWEQWLSSGASAHAILLAAEAMGYGAIWLTGAFSQHPIVREGLGVGSEEKIVSFVYVGTKIGAGKSITRVSHSERVSFWGGSGVLHS